MIKTIFAGILFILSSVSFAAECGKAAPINDTNFCASFKKAATCHCTAKGLPLYICQNMKLLYTQMTTIYGSLEDACSPSAQKETTREDCIATWKCYKSGTGEQQSGNKYVKCARVCEKF